MATAAGSELFSSPILVLLTTVRLCARLAVRQRFAKGFSGTDVMTGLAVFLVLLFSLVVAECNDTVDKHTQTSTEVTFVPPLTTCIHQDDPSKACNQSEDKEDHVCLDIQDCCRKAKDRCRKAKDRCRKAKDRCRKAKDRCRKAKVCCCKVKDCCRKIQECCQEKKRRKKKRDRCQQLCAAGIPVMVTVLIFLAVLIVVVVVVAVFFFRRRKRGADDVRKENNQSCLSAAINFERSQDSQENKRTNFGNDSTATDDDNNDEYTYIDGPAINKGVVRLHQDRSVTTDGQLALTDPSVSGLQPDLSSTYRLARPIDNNIPDSQPPDYFILEKDPAPDAEPTQHFTTEDESEKDSAEDTDTQHYFILEDWRQGVEVMSSESGADYFVLEKDRGQESDCVARDDA